MFSHKYAVAAPPVVQATECYRVFLVQGNVCGTVGDVGWLEVALVALVGWWVGWFVGSLVWFVG